MNGRICYVASSAAMIILAALAIGDRNAMVSIFSMIGLVLYGVLAIKNPRFTQGYKLALVTMIIVFVFGALILYNYDFDGERTRNIWAYELGAITWVVTFSLGSIMLTAVAMCSGARFNWPLIGGFLMFCSLAICVLGYVGMACFNGGEIDDGTILQVDNVEGLMTNAVLSVICGIAISRIAKKKRFMIAEEKE